MGLATTERVGNNQMSDTRASRGAGADDRRKLASIGMGLPDCSLQIHANLGRLEA